MMDLAEHKKKHRKVDALLVELVAEYVLYHPDTLLGEMTVLDLMGWSYEQTENPIERIRNG